MGIDFIEKAKDSFKRCWDRGRSRLADHDLFTISPDVETRAISVVPISSGALGVGDECLLRTNGNGITTYSKTNEVLGHCAVPPADLAAGIAKAGGSALGRVAKVHGLSGRVDVEVEQ